MQRCFVFQEHKIMFWLSFEVPCPLKVGCKHVEAEDTRRKVAQWRAQLFPRDGMSDEVVQRLNLEKANPTFHTQALKHVQT